MNKALAGIKILVVDDEPDIIDLLSDSLRLYGASVQTAQSGNEALAMIAKDEYLGFDIILSDIRMSNGDGITLLKEVRKRYPAPPPFFFITGFTDCTRQQALEMGASEVFTKPFNVDALVDKFLEILPKKS